jgi:hypothetical protein
LTFLPVARIVVPEMFSRGAKRWESMKNRRGRSRLRSPLPSPDKEIVSMSSQHSPFAQRFAAALEKMKRSGSNAYAYDVNDTDRMVELLEAAIATFDVNDPTAVEGVFAIQGISLDVIFTDFIRRKGFTFDNMRVALRAQAQCRATFRTLSDFKNPPPKSSPLSKKSSDQSVESAKIPVGVNA